MKFKIKLINQILSKIIIVIILKKIRIKNKKILILLLKIIREKINYNNKNKYQKIVI